jgi:hypothetical protein
VLPNNAAATAPWLTVSTADADSDFPCSRPDHAVSVTPPSAIVTWADYPLRFQFPRMQLASDDDRLFSFVSNVNATAATATCALTRVPDGHATPLDASVAVSHAQDPDRPFGYLVTAPVGAPGDVFFTLDCVVTMRIGALDADTDYSLVVDFIGRYKVLSPPVHALGKPQLEPLPTVTIEAVGTLQVDFVITQLRIRAGSGLSLGLVDSTAAIFTAIQCAYPASAQLSSAGFFIRFDEEIPLSLVPVRVPCAALVVEAAMGQPVYFPSHQDTHEVHVPATVFPVFPNPSPVVKVTSVSNTLAVAVESFEKYLIVSLQRPADRRRVKNAWSSSGCDLPETRFRHGSSDDTSVFDTEWTIFANVGTTIPTRCTLFAEFLYSSIDASLDLILEVPMTGAEGLRLGIPIPPLEAVLPTVTLAEVSTLTALAVHNVVMVDRSFTSKVALTNLWPSVLNQETSSSGNQFFTKDGSSFYAGDDNRLVMTPYRPDDDIATAFIVIQRGAWPVQPSGSRFSLYVDGIEYPGSFAPPPLVYSLIVRQPTVARPGEAYVIEATFAAPAIAHETLTMVFDMEQLPVLNPLGCSVEGFAAYVDIPETGVYSVNIPISRSRTPNAGSVPLSLPHVTMQCVFQLGDEVALVNARRFFSVWVRGDKEQVVRTNAVLHAPGGTAMAVRVSLTLKHDEALAGKKMRALLDALTVAVASHVAGFAAEQAAVHEQSRVAKGWTAVTVELTSRAHAPVTTGLVRDIADELVDAARSLGYTVADGADETVSGHLVDAVCSYTCGAGCRLCEDDQVCAWGLDCRSGACKDGVCHTPSAPPADLTWVWVSLAAAVGVVATVVGVQKLRRLIRKRQEEYLLNGHYELNEDM